MFIFFVILFLIVHGQDYHTTNELFNAVQKECHGKLSCRWHKDILIVDWDSPSDEKVMLVFNEHARERVTGELGLKLIQLLHKWNPSVDITIIPVLNVWGRKQVEHGHPCVRKNEHGVDPNRNYQMSSNRHHYYRSSEEYEGSNPLSEKESKLVSNELKHVRRYINIHSGEFSLYMPYDSRTRKPPHYKAMHKKIQDWHRYCPQCAVGPAATTSFYKAYGTSVDWAIDHGVSESYTFEIYGKETWDCEKMFNPDDLSNTFRMWLPILKDALKM